MAGSMLMTRDLPALIVTSSGSLNTSGIGNLDDAYSITLCLTTSAGALLLLPTIQISQYDPASTLDYVSGQSTQWFASTTLPAWTVGGSLTFFPGAIRGIRIVSSAGSSMVAGTVVATAMKQIWV